MSARQPSLEPSGDAVKEPKASSTSGAKPTGFGRLFEGWELGGVIAALVTSTFFYLLMGRYPGKTESPVAETMPDPGFSRAG